MLIFLSGTLINLKFFCFTEINHDIEWPLLRGRILFVGVLYDFEWSFDILAHYDNYSGFGAFLLYFFDELRIDKDWLLFHLSPLN